MLEEFEKLRKARLKEEIFITEFNGGETNYKYYKDLFTKKEYLEIVKKAKDMANIYEESWSENE